MKFFVLVSVLQLTYIGVLVTAEEWSELCHRSQVETSVSFELLVPIEDLKTPVQDIQEKLNTVTAKMDENKGNQSVTSLTEVQIQADVLLAYNTLHIKSLLITIEDEICPNPPGIYEVMEYHTKDILPSDAVINPISMKIKNAILNVVEMEESRSTYETIDEVLKLINSDEWTLNEENKDVVVLLGNTGSGKSTFTQWIAETDNILTAVEYSDGEYVIEDAKNKISRDTITSQTLYPELVTDKVNDIVYYDLPGFSDTRSTATDIATSHFTTQIIEHANKVKILLVVNHSSLRQGIDRKDFLLLLRQLLDVIKNVDKYTDSIALIVTKVDNYYKKGILVTDETVVEGVAAFLEEAKRVLQNRMSNTEDIIKWKFYEDSIKLLDILLKKDGKNYSRIGLFRRPDQDGAIDEMTTLETEKKHIKKIINDKLLFTNISLGDFGNTVSESSKNDIRLFIDTIQDNILKGVCNVFHKIKQKDDLEFAKIRDQIQNMSSNVNPVDNLNRISVITLLLDNVSSELENDTLDSIFQSKHSKIISNLRTDNSYLTTLLSTIHKDDKTNFTLTASNNVLQDTLHYLNSTKANIKSHLENIKENSTQKISSDLKILIDEIIKQYREKEEKVLDIDNFVEYLGNEYDNLLEFVNTSDMNIIYKYSNATIPSYLITNADNYVINELKARIHIVITYLQDAKLWYQYLITLFESLLNIDVQIHSADCSEIFLKNSDVFKSLQECFPDSTIPVYNNENKPIDNLKIWHLQNIIKLALSSPETICERTKMVLRGAVVKVSHINSKACTSSVDTIHVFAAHAIFVDQDLTLLGDDLRLSLVAPKIVVIGDREIVLKGNSGANTREFKAQDGRYAGSRGSDGEPGLPGSNGGSFLGIARYIINSEHLTVISVGGDGGSGQDGGDGENGTDGTTPYITDPQQYLINKGFYYNKQFYDCGSFSCDYHAIRGTSCTNGGDGGKGGRGGYGGYPGSTEMDATSPNNVKFVHNKGKDGYDGRSGEAGRAGRPGKEALINWKWIRFWDTTKVTYRNLPSCTPGQKQGWTNDRGIRKPLNPKVNKKTVIQDYVEYTSTVLPKIGNGYFNGFLDIILYNL